MPNSSRAISFDDSASKSSARSRKIPAVVRTRTTVAGVLTSAAIAIGILVALALGRTAVALYALALPVPLALLWLAADVVRADERDG